jgi:hypothetical protein
MTTMANTGTTTRAERASGALAPRRSSLGWAGYAACVWSLAYMLPHLYWAAGGTAMLSAFRPAVAEEPAFRLINGVASAMLTGAALVALMLARRPDRRMLHGALLAIACIGCALSVAHGVYGIIDRTLIVTGVTLVESRPFALDEHAWVLWDLLVFEPWFLIEGVLFGLAGWAFLTQAQDRRRWAWLCVLGVLAALATALLGVRVA